MSNKHLYWALFWKFLWSYKRKWYLLIPFTLIPYVGIYYMGMLKGEPKNFNETITQPISSADIMKSANMIAIKYTPEGNETKIIMESAQKMLQNISVKSMKNKEEIEKEIAKDYNKGEKENKTQGNLTYGVIFETVTKQKFQYILRCSEGKDWGSGKQYPDVQSEGQMKAGAPYFHRNFIALQMAINSGYLDYLGVEENNFSLQEFPQPKYVEQKTFDPMALSLVVVGSLSPLLLYMLIKVANEKKSGARAMMILNGVKMHLIYVYWIIFFFIPLYIAICLMAMTAGSSKLMHGQLLLLCFWILLFVYVVTSMALIFALTSLLNPTYALLVFLLSQVLIVIIIFIETFKTTSFLGILTVLTPAGSLAHGIGMIAFYEQSGIAFKSEDLTSNKGPRFHPYLLIILAPLITMVFLMLLSVYMELVKPGEYGRAKPWYFILPKSMKERLRAKNEFNPNPRRSSVALVEEKLNNKGEIRVRNLRKVFKKFVALNNFSVDFYKGQITALLGHNGAGKTTFLYTITGITSPTSGEIFYKENDVLLNFNEFRESFGFCPQQNILMNDMSVKQQIVFFGMVKKMKKAEAVEFVNDFLEKVNMSDKKNKLPKKLSGGMKRKLCLANAIVNDPPVLFMDEPSSGLDPESRRSLWDIILELRKDRTIIITTHFMEEADILSDRIAIMANGELRCIGSPIFLKKHYGFGHSISINYKNNPEEIIKFVNSYVKATNKVDPNMKQVTFNVPMEETSNLSALFAGLESVVEKNSISVSSTSMESVFLKVQEGEGITTEFDKSDIAFVVQELPKNKGGSKFFQQICSLMHKRALSLKHDWFLYVVMMLFIPILMAILVMVFLNALMKPKLAEDVSTVLELNFYGKTDVMINGTGNGSESFQKVVEKQGSSAVIINRSLSDELMETAKKDDAFRYKYVVAGEFGNESATIFYSSVAYHAAPIAVGLYYNSFLNTSSISTTNHPYTFATEVCGMFLVLMFLIMLGLLAVTLLFCMCYFNHFPAKERIAGIKHLQYMAGLNPVTYWISNLVFDIALCIVTIIIITLIILIMDGYEMYKDADVLVGFFLIFFVFSFTIILWCYILSTTMLSFNLSTIIIVSWVCGFAIVYNILYNNVKSSEPYLYWLHLFTPLPACLSGIKFIVITSSSRQMCQRCSIDEETCKENNESLLSKEQFYMNLLWMLVHSAILILVLFLLEYNIFRYLHYLCTRRWYKKSSEDMDEDVQLEKYGVDQYLGGNQWKRAESVENRNSRTSNLAGDRVVYTVLVDTSSFSRLTVSSRRPSTTPRTSTSTSPKTPTTTSTPSTSPKTPTTTSTTTPSSPKTPTTPRGSLRRASVRPIPVLIAERLTKMYSSKSIAAEQVSFAAMKGECFGLLGVSGAGKSTVFGMLSGIVYPTSGNAYIFENNHRHKLKIIGFNFIQKMGYCPQEYWILDQLTARQLMTHFAHLRGVKKNLIKDSIGRWIKILDLHNYCDKPCGTYSGGNKRKLSTALALIGKPIIILLDEPTTGVDPVARRKLWQVFKLVKNTDQTMILTSHSMDECEAVCNRLTIMANGKMQCIGKINYLKNKHAQGCTILIKLNVNAKSEMEDKIRQSMISNFGNNCVLTDQQKGVLQFHLKEKLIKWSVVFSKMEKIKKTFNVIEEYMLSSTSLEQIFLSFANK